MIWIPNYFPDHTELHAIIETLRTQIPNTTRRGRAPYENIDLSPIKSSALKCVGLLGDKLTLSFQIINVFT